MAKGDGEVSLRDYVETQFELRDRAIEVAQADVERRLDGMNQLREQISEERGLYVTRELYDAATDRISKLEAAVLASAAVSDRSDISLGQIIGVVAILLTVAAILVGAFT